MSVADGFDPAGAHADVIVAVMAWAAQTERLATAERIAAARAFGRVGVARPWCRSPPVRTDVVRELRRYYEPV